jgi:hypothetical protein
VGNSADVIAARVSSGDTYNLGFSIEVPAALDRLLIPVTDSIFRPADELSFGLGSCPFVAAALIGQIPVHTIGQTPTWPEEFEFVEPWTHIRWVLVILGVAAGIGLIIVSVVRLRNILNFGEPPPDEDT